jgi:RNA polymerase sigma factor (sigma-70 family)
MSKMPSHAEVPHSNDFDQSMWQEFIAGSDKAYEQLYDRYIDDLYRYGNMFARDGLLVEDAIHDVFTDIWNSRKRLNRVNNVRLYLFLSVKRRILRKLKKERTFLHSMNDTQLFSFESVPSFLDDYIHEKNRESLEKKIELSLAKISARQREILYLRFYQNMSYSQIAELLELDQKYVYNCASKAFGALRLIIADYLPLFLLLIAGKTLP